MERRPSGAVHSGTNFGLLGAVLGFGSIGSSTVARALGNGFDFIVLLGCIAFLAALAVLGWSGVAPARTSGRAASGAGAGAIAGAFTGAGLLIGLLVDGTQRSVIATPSGGLSILGYVIGVIILLALSAAITAGLGAGLGALGGLIGRGQAQRMTPPMYAPGYPGYPGYPPSPAAGMPPYGQGWPPTYPGYPPTQQPYAGETPYTTFPSYPPPPPNEPGR